MSPNLQAYVDEIHTMALEDSIKAIADLLPCVITSVSPNATYLMRHPDYEGEAKFDDLGKYFLNNNQRCFAENAPLRLRLLQSSLDDKFEGIYGELYKAAVDGVKNGTIKPEPREDQGCACCAGEPAAVIGMGFHHGNAFLYTIEQYRQLWGHQQNHGSRSGWMGDSWDEQWYASKEQVEEALARESTPIAGRL
ncbi:hypothetical protein N7468_004874 [Penicillium chermesinum]|uniref:Uncharacterized protein n=1 Tax=Penicillium chermesinum TaxID=63820 RepID=A0A9W9P9J9_9EURO|nr:uncharacterized protein N7468_004874 [Penicillium chermesinum]KAJ5240255.1 hypothetical protein N7468_004874 [Penicillium chermesinum]KAJ6167124.1 hypothetical protein N7470_002571 [Penicillium chermesinum]